MTEFEQAHPYLTTYQCYDFDGGCQVCRYANTASGGYCSTWTGHLINEVDFRSELEPAAITRNCNKEIATYYTKNGNGSNRHQTNNWTAKNVITEDDQCVLVISRQAEKLTKNHQTCDKSVCLTYLSGLGSLVNMVDFDYGRWKELRSFDNLNRRIGGRHCSIVASLGYSIIIPLCLNLMFHTISFYYDLKKSKAHICELGAVALFFYPQWKCIKLLVRYAYKKNLNQLIAEKQEYERDVETLEAFTESGLQVT